MFVWLLRTGYLNLDCTLRSCIEHVAALYL
jgi:hypothetical protein